MLLCTNCGYRNPDGSKFCIKCGYDLAARLPPVICPSCGSENTPRAVFCETCGKRIAPEVPVENKPVEPGTVESIYTPLLESEHKSFLESRGKTFVAGILLVLGGSIDVVNAIASFYREIPSTDTGIDLSGYVACCATLSIIFGVGAILGGWLSLSRKYFYAVLVGAVMGMLGLGFLGLGALVCLIALILVAISKDEYSG